MRKILATLCVAVTTTFGAVAAHAQNSGGTLSFLVQPEPPTLASYVSTSGPIGLVMPKVCMKGCLITQMMAEWFQF